MIEPSPDVVNTSGRTNQGRDLPKILVINQYYTPDYAATGQIAAELCSGFSTHGLQVQVVTGMPSYTDNELKAPSFEMLNGVHVHRVGMGRTVGRERLKTRLAGFIRFSFRGWLLGRKLVKSQHPNAVITFGNPPIIAFVAFLLARNSHAKFVYILHDIHPDILINSGFKMLPRPLLWVFNRIHIWVLKRADTIVVLGEGMKHTLVAKKGVKEGQIHVIPLWARPELGSASKNVELRKELGVNSEELFLLYAGNMGIMHPLDNVLDAAVACRDLNVKFLLVGDGARRKSLMDRVADEAISNVLLLPFQPEARFAEIMTESDVSLVVLKPGLEGLAVPSKAYTSMGAGKPMITMMEGHADVARMVTHFECGWNVSSTRELVGLLQDLIVNRDELIRRGCNGRRAYRQNFTREKAIANYMDIINSG